MIDPRLLYDVTYTQAGMKGAIHLLAIGVAEERGRVTFHDTVRLRCIEGKVKHRADGFTVRRKREAQLPGDIPLDDTWDFRVLTLAEYNRRVRPRLDFSAPTFTSDAEMHEFYRRRVLGGHV